MKSLILLSLAFSSNRSIALSKVLSTVSAIIELRDERIILEYVETGTKWSLHIESEATKKKADVLGQSSTLLVFNGKQEKLDLNKVKATKTCELLAKSLIHLKHDNRLLLNFRFETDGENQSTMYFDRLIRGATGYTQTIDGTKRLRYRRGRFALTAI